MAWQDGITKIVLTPHVYRLSKNNDDFGLLEKRIAEFNSRVKKSPIDFYRGAEVFLDPDIAGSLRERNLTINGSDAVLDNKPIPDYGDPSRPEKAHSKWSICFPRKRE
jgi:tyrosine-protein phosphatase YwqE